MRSSQTGLLKFLFPYAWNVKPLDIQKASCSFFDDTSVFPEGTAKLDCALLMRDVDHEWHGRPTLCCDAASVSPASLAAAKS